MKDIDSQLGNISGDLLTQVLEGTPVPTFVIDESHRILHWNHACEIVTGYSAHLLVGTTHSWKPFYSEERPTMANLILDQRANEIPNFYQGKCSPSTVIEDAWEAEDFFPHFPGGGKWLSFTARLLRNEEGNVAGAIETLRDITAQKRSEKLREESLHLLDQIVAGCPVPIFILDKEHKVTHWNRACETIIGTPASDVVGTKEQWKAFYPEERPVLADLILDSKNEQLSEFYQGKWKAAPLIDGAWEASDHFPHFKSGGKWLYFTAAPIQTSDGTIIGAVETLQDISTQKLYEQELEHQAKHDSLTKLPNRTLLMDRLSQAVAHAERDNRLLAVMFIDLDDFKIINDSLGHRSGDELLIEVANRLKNSIRVGDTVARLGGDEFVALLFAPENEGYITDVTKRIIDDLSKAIPIGRNQFFVRCSVGVSIYPQDGDTPEALLKNANSAMYRVKARGKGGFRFFTQDINARAQERLELEQGLYTAVRENQLELYYQPLYTLSTGKVAGAEALLRWNHPARGLVLPSEFIPIAEQTGLIVPIGDWVLKTALIEARKWSELANDPLRISVNVSARQFQRGAIMDSMRHHFIDFKDTNLNLELEVTESIVMHNPEQANELLQQLKKIGAHLAMDDFGTGYSSLAYLRRFPFDMVKIDRAFIHDLGQNKEAEAVVRAVLELGTALGLQMVAEGVETEAQRVFLEMEGCHEVQGFLFSKPLPAQKFREHLQNNAKLSTLDSLGAFI